MDKTLLREAKKALRFSYSPYSGCKVACALRLSDGTLFSGTNIENASYGATVCAERVAIFKARSQKKTCRIKSLLVLVDAPDPWPPCGLCLQVIAEFAASDLSVFCCNTKGQAKEFRFVELLPQGFNRRFLK